MSDRGSNERDLLLSKHQAQDTESGSAAEPLDAPSTTPANSDRTDAEEVEKPFSRFSIYTVVPILLLGVFVANADGSLVIATSHTVASEFNSFSDASWLVTSYILAMCASQPLYGRLSDIFGRKAALMAAYTFFTAGCFICGIGAKFSHILMGRAISGIGGAGMTALISIIIADMVPVRDVASWRSYVNIAATVGRSIGGPVGGWLTDTVGWRWSFLGQCPLTITGLLLITWKLSLKIPQTLDLDEDNSKGSKFYRVDVAGAGLLATSISSFVLFLDFAAKDVSWTSSPIVVCLIVFLCVTVLFVQVEKNLAKEPIMPIPLISNRDVYVPNLIVALQVAAQFALMFSIPIYFQISTGMSVTGAGSRLVPAVIGNAVGGLLSGLLIRKTGRYKILTLFGTLFACLGYLWVLLSWHGNTNWLELMYTVPGGFGMGVVQSTTFIHVAASLKPSEMAVAGTAFYLSLNIGLLVGLNAATALIHSQVTKNLSQNLGSIPHKEKIIARVVSSVENVHTLPPGLKTVVVKSYIDALIYSHGLSLSLSFLAFLICLSLRERKL